MKCLTDAQRSEVAVTLRQLADTVESNVNTTGVIVVIEVRGKPGKSTDLTAAWRTAGDSAVQEVADSMCMALAAVENWMPDTTAFGRFHMAKITLRMGARWLWRSLLQMPQWWS